MGVVVFGENYYVKDEFVGDWVKFWLRCCGWGALIIEVFLISFVLVRVIGFEM